MTNNNAPTVGSLFAGIGGFDLGFERAGFRTAWQVELHPINRAVLAHHFPHAQQFADVRDCGAGNLCPVDVIVGGFPCQDVSIAGKRAGLAGERTGLFWEALRIVEEIRPQWLVLENVVGLLHSNAGRDFGLIVQALAARGYVGCWRVLDSRYFGVAQTRRRVFLVAGFGRQPPPGLLADAAPVDGLPLTLGSVKESRGASRQPAYALLATAGCSIAISCEPLVRHPDMRGAMDERARISADAGLPLGMDGYNIAQRYAAGNAVTVPVAEWIAKHLRTAFDGAGHFAPTSYTDPDKATP